MLLSNFATFHSFQITGGFVSGINQLDFQATNLGGPGGLNVNSLVLTASPSGSAVPEPSALALSTIGVLGLAGSAWRRRQRSV